MNTWSGATGDEPTYTADTPFATVPQTGTANTLALEFDGNDHLATMGGHGSVTPKMVETYPFTNGWTIEATFKLDRTDIWQVIVGKDGKPTGAAQAPFWIKMRDFGGMEVGFFDDDEIWRAMVIEASYFSIDQWISIAATYDNSTFNIYGKREGIDTGYGLLATDSFSATASLDWPVRIDPETGWRLDHGWSIGDGCWNGTNGVNKVDGIIDEVRISNVALNPSQFLAKLGVPPPAIGDITMELLPGGLALTWTTSDLYTYALLKKTALTDPAWSSYSNGIPGGVSNVTVTVPVDSAKAFYKATSE